jgi:PIN domain nuclease of toxin-antitoxin system
MTAVIDAAALLCVLLDEPGADQVLPVLRAGLISAVNLSESCSRGLERGIPIEAVLRGVQRLEMVAVAFDAQQAEATARLREPTRSLGLSLGDRACLALALREGAPVFTGDRRLGRIDPALGIDIRLIR